MLGGFNLHSAPDGAVYIRGTGYKHIAPPEQEPLIPTMTTFHAKLVQIEGAVCLFSFLSLLCLFVANSSLCFFVALLHRVAQVDH